MNKKIVISFVGFAFISLLLFKSNSSEEVSYVKPEVVPIHVKMNPSLTTAYQPLGKPNANDVFGSEFVLRNNDLVRIVFRDPKQQLSAACLSNTRIWLERQAGKSTSATTTSSCWEMSADNHLTPNGLCNLYVPVDHKLVISMRYPVNACTVSDVQNLIKLKNLIEVN